MNDDVYKCQACKEYVDSDLLHSCYICDKSCCLHCVIWAHSDVDEFATCSDECYSQSLTKDGVFE